MKTYTVEVRTTTGEWTRENEYESYRDAVDAAGMKGGRIVGEREAWRWAVKEQGFEGSYDEWTAQDDEERGEYEDAAAGIATD